MILYTKKTFVFPEFRKTFCVQSLLFLILRTLLNHILQIPEGKIIIFKVMELGSSLKRCYFYNLKFLFSQVKKIRNFSELSDQSQK